MSSAALPGVPIATWIGGRIPAHPAFDRLRDIVEIVDEQENELWSYCDHALGQLGVMSSLGRSMTSHRWPRRRQLARWAVLGQRYGAIYPLSRRRAGEIASVLGGAEWRYLDQLADELAEGGVPERVLNYAVHRFLSSPARRRTYVSRAIPQSAFQALGHDHVAVRRSDLVAQSAATTLDVAHPVYDLHDFAHLVAATLCPQLYANRYHEPGFRALASDLQELITSPRLGTTNPRPLSDGLVFSEFLTHLFNELNEPDRATASDDLADEDELVDAMADALVPYFLDGAALRQPSTSMSIAAPSPVKPAQLAVLMQNKAYELPASEIEQHVFTRGGESQRDDLSKMPTSQRIRTIAELHRRTHHERRNILKHRAHKAAYQRIARRLLADRPSPPIRRLLSATLHHANYEDWMCGARLNLFDAVASGETT